MAGGNISQRKDFTYPPILPIVYYEGKREWTAITNFKDRVLFNDIFAKYIPTFSYELVNLHQYSNLELASHNDEISLLMLLNRVQDMDDFKELLNLRGFRKDAWENTPEYLLDILVHITTILLSRLNLPEEEIAAALEEDLTSIHSICEIAKKYAPEYDVTAICEEVIQTTSHRSD